MGSESIAEAVKGSGEEGAVMVTQEEIEEERRVKDGTVKDMNRALINTIKKIQQRKEMAKLRAQQQQVSRPA